MTNMDVDNVTNMDVDNGVQWDFFTLNHGFDGRLEQLEHETHEHQIPFHLQFQDEGVWDMLDKYCKDVMEDWLEFNL